ncbi:MAG: XRE family transcriptional regulator [Gammaproteobacteria bacterium]|nr:XRE family transcriptional regulator [Gammaproteobacteria bacterium]MBQ0774730.1 XRE family transcriptional regulator [Gammaproteobacteria bacterium]
MTKPAQSETYSSVWDAICDTPEEADLLKLRSDLMIRIQENIKEDERHGVSRNKSLGLTQARTAELTAGMVGGFDLESLVAIATRLGMKVSFKVT